MNHHRTKPQSLASCRKMPLAKEDLEWCVSCPPLGRGCTVGEKRCQEGEGRAEKFRPRQNCLSVRPPPWVPAALGQDCAEPPWTPGVRPGLSRRWLLPRARLPEAESSSSSASGPHLSSAPRGLPSSLDPTPQASCILVGEFSVNHS